jgi:hypothetical protein
LLSEVAMKPRHASFVAAALWGSLVLAGACHAQGIRPAVSNAETPKAYKVDAARHIYAAYPDKIYKGKLPPMIHAIVVLEVDLDDGGNVRQVQTLRVPTHAPDVTRAVLDMIQHASPMPAPRRMGGAKFTEVWLVDKSGRFQLDTLTEGQR